MAGFHTLPVLGNRRIVMSKRMLALLGLAMCLGLAVIGSVSAQPDAKAGKAPVRKMSIYLVTTKGCVPCYHVKDYLGDKDTVALFDKNVANAAARNPGLVQKPRERCELTHKFIGKGSIQFWSTELDQAPFHKKTKEAIELCPTTWIGDWVEDKKTWGRTFLVWRGADWSKEYDWKGKKRPVGAIVEDVTQTVLFGTDKEVAVLAADPAILVTTGKD